MAFQVRLYIDYIHYQYFDYQWMNEWMVFNDPFNSTGHTGPSYQWGDMNDDMMKYPFELSQDADSNQWPLAHKGSMLPLTQTIILDNI